MRYLALATASFLAWVLVMVLLVHPALMDVRVYRAEGAALLHGLDLYGPLHGVHGVDTYPPFAALLFAPVALAPVASVETASVVANLGLLLVVSWQSVRLARGGGSLAATAVLAAVALWSEPVTTTLSYGQIDLLLLALVLWDANLPPESRLRGIGIGLAAAVKVTPGILVVYLLLTGRLRAATAAAATVAATIGLTALVDASGTWSYWTHQLFDYSRMGRLENAANQSVRGLLVRAHHVSDIAPVDLLPVLAVLVAGLGCAVLAHRWLGDAWGLLTAATTGLLVSPISWSHHWVWCVPVLALLWHQARVWVVPALLVFWSYAVWLVPHGGGVELRLSGVDVARSGAYVVAGLGFLALAATLTVQRRRHLLEGLGPDRESRALSVGAEPRTATRLSGWPDHDCRAGRIVRGPATS